MRVTRVEITGNEPQRPPYAQSVPFETYVNALTDGIDGQNRAPVAPQRLRNRLSRDPDRWDLVSQAVASGPARLHAYHFDQLTSALVRNLTTVNRYLELTDRRNPEIVRREVQTRAQRGLSDYDYETRIGGGLRDGLLVVNGSLDAVHGLKGGTIHVNGDVGKVEQTNSGVLYVNGDIHRLDNVNSTIIVASGKIHEYRGTRNGYAGSLNTSSPFVFAGEIGKIARDLETGIPGDRYQPRSDSHMTIALDQLAGWKPSETKRKATRLAKDVASMYAQEILKRARGIKSPQDLTAFMASYMQAFAEGYSSGYSTSSSYSPGSDID